VGFIMSFRFTLRTQERRTMMLLLFVVTASHGALDALTNGGLGVAFFSPFNRERYFLPWTPVEVSPIGAGGFFSDCGMEVILSEIIWLWGPLIVLGAVLYLLNMRKRDAGL
jgi:inner membrane protein